MSTVADLLERYYTEVWTAWDMEPVDELVSAAVTIKTAFMGDELYGPDILYAHMGAMKAAFPDLTATLSDVEVDGDAATATVRWTGTHTGHIWRTEGTGNALDVTTSVRAASRDGRLTEVVEATDWAEVRASIDAAPPEEIELPDQRVIPCFRSTDWEVTRRFYTQTLGFRVLFEWRHGCDFPVYAGIERDGVQLHISEHTGDAEVGGSISIEWDDVDALYADLVERGLEGVDPPEGFAWGERGFNLRDPDGNNIGFTKAI